MRRARILAGITLVVLLGGAVALSFRNQNDRLFDIARNMKIFAKLFQEVNTYYVDDVNPTSMMNIGIEAMLSTLDPYTNYIPEDEIEDYRTVTTGEYGGVGILVRMHNDKVVVMMPSKGYAAFKAGIQIGDEIVKVDGIEISGKNTNDISKLLKGQAGTEVTLTLRRYGKDEPFAVSIKRENIHVSNVPYYGMVNGEIGLIQLTDFTRGAGREVADALKDLKGKGAKKIILDLRGNPGGLLNEAIEICNVFLPFGLEIVSTKGRIKEWNRTHKALDKPLDVEIPLAVLINGGSASASEIVAGVVQDYDRGVLVGKRSFGKGLVQATRSLEFNSRLKVTVAKYYIPSGRCIQAIDYSHKDTDGIAGKLPDSLRVAYKTQNGRVVYDGAGISPDVEITPQYHAQITRSLLSKGLVFDYATVYKHKNAQIPAAKEFKLSDKEYDTFVAWLKDKDYEYKNEVEKAVEGLVASAKKDKYYEELIKEIEMLDSKIIRKKENDLYKFKVEIKELLESEIVSRYYLEEGVIEASFDDDTDIREAVSILSNTETYKSLLAPSESASGREKSSGRR